MLSVVRHFAQKMTVLPQPSYSPDLIPLDFFILQAEMPLSPKEGRFDTTEEIKQSLEELQRMSEAVVAPSGEIRLNKL